MMPSDIEVVGQKVSRKPIVFDPKLSRDILPRDIELI